MTDDDPDDSDEWGGWERLGELVVGAGRGIRDAGVRVREAAAGTETKRARLRMGGATVAVLAVLGGFAATAWLGWGWLSGVLFIGGLVVGVSGPPIAILMLRNGIPLNGLVATGLAIAAQVAFGEAALVRREDGQYEWSVLREDARGYYARLSTGDRVAIDADEGELFSFGFGKLAVTEQHGRNLEPYREIDTPGSSDTPVDTRAGVDVRPPRVEDGGILVSLAAIQRRVRGSASSKLVRRGRDKALDEEGGTGQLSPLWTMAFAVVLLIVAFGMTSVVLLI